LKQDSTTAQLIFSVADLIAYVSNIMTLLPGDIISTGTPSGIGPLAAGDVFTVKVAGVGELTNPVEMR
jgi:2-keto-4-pentenoate hydratase/2-oxohepta-3-ene-1,7-dioic acid hydratase in catechol pathway